jgi:hypothetical protein
MFLVWSAATVPLVAWSWIRFRRWRVRQLPTGRASLVVVASAWALVVTLSLSGVGPEMALDGLIMRDGLLRNAGKAVQWVPGAFGLILAVAGLAAALEARYRLAHGQAGGEASPPDQAR